MKKLKLSQWNDGKIKPSRAGLYQRRLLCGIKYCWFDKVWFVWGTDAKDAYHEFRLGAVSSNKELQWRGVLK